MKREFPDWSLGSRRYSCLVFPLLAGRALATLAKTVRMVRKLVYISILPWVEDEKLYQRCNAASKDKLLLR